MSALRTAACATVLAALTACGIPYDDQPRALQPREVPQPSGLASPPVADPDGDIAVPLYFVREGQVELVPRAVDRPITTAELVELLLRGLAPEEGAAGLTTRLPPALTVEDVTTTGGTAVITLGGPDSEGENIPALAVAQVVATVTPQRASGVRFRLGDRDLQVPQGDGSLTTAPVSRADYAQLITAAPPPSAAAGPTPEGPPAPSGPVEPPPA